MQGDLLNNGDLESLFNNHEFDAVMHFSARSLVGESMINPAVYMNNTVVGTFNLGTPDGTCIRDYVHVNDLCKAHLSALRYLNNHKGNFAFNLGNGSGFSVMEVINAASRIVGSPIDYCITKRWEGDPVVLVSDSSLAKQELGWEPQSLGRLCNACYFPTKKPIVYVRGGFDLRNLT